MPLAALVFPTPPVHDGVLGLCLRLRHGGTQHVHLRWRLIGAEGTPIHAVLGGISATRQVAAVSPDEPEGWWQGHVGPGRVFDLAHVRVLGFDWIGRDGGLDAPIDTHDQADALAALLEHLGIDQLASVVGSSYGAMVALAFAEAHPNRAKRFVVISGADRPDPFASAWRALQRRVLDLGGGSTEAVALARQLALLSYRTPEEFAQRFDAGPQWQDKRLRCAAEDYLDAAAHRFALGFSPVAYRRLSESIDAHRVDPARLRAPVSIIAVAEDRLVPLGDLQRLAEAIPGPTRLDVIHSIFGHDAFLKEPEAIGRLLTVALAPSPSPTGIDASAIASNSPSRLPSTEVLA